MIVRTHETQVARHQARGPARATAMTYHHEMTPNGRTYRRRDGTLWTIELEVGGAVWLKSDSGQVITARADQLSGAEWERVA